MPAFLFPITTAIAVILFFCLFITVCYKKAPPTEAIVITGLGHKEPKVVCGNTADGIRNIGGNVPVMLAKTFDTVRDATGIDLLNIVNANSYDAKVNRQVTMDVDAGRLTEPHPEATMADEDWADK